MITSGTPQEIRLRTSVQTLSNATEIVARLVMDSATTDVQDSAFNSPITLATLKASIQARFIKNLDNGVKK